MSHLHAVPDLDDPRAALLARARELAPRYAGEKPTADQAAFLRDTFGELPPARATRRTA